MGLSVNRSRSAKAGTADPAGRPSPAFSPVGIACAGVPEDCLLSKTPGRTKLPASTRPAPRTARTCQLHRRVRRRCPLDLTAGAEARACRRAALAVLPLIAVTTFLQDCEQEAADQREQDRERDEVRGAVDVRGDLAHPGTHRLLETGRGF